MVWFIEKPEILQYEENCLLASGFNYTIDEVAHSEGRLIINVVLSIEDEHHNLRCIYPPSYPFFPPKIFAPTLPAGRHIDPYEGLVCLFENEQSVWNSHSDTLAKVIEDQIPKILHEHNNADNLSEIEGDDGYQVSGQFPYEQISVILTDDWKIPDDVKSGKLCIRVRKQFNSKTPCSGYVDSISYNAQDVEHSSTKFLEEYFPSKIQCRWVRLDSPPAAISGEKVLAEAIAVDPSIKNVIFNKNDCDIVGLVYEEDSDKHTKVLNWVFIIRRKVTLNRIQKQAKQKNYVVGIIRSDRYTPQNIQQRIPRLKPITQKKALVIGLGALGSNVAWQLARAGVENLTLIDFDIVQAGNIPRWLLGFPAIGRFKTEVLRSHLLLHFPHIDCQIHNIQIGSALPVQTVHGTSIDTHDLLIEVIQNSDIVIDCTAETNVNHYVSHLAEQNETSYVWATATQGAWGGIVGRVIPGVTEGRWIDFSYLNKINQISVPSAEEGSNIQPVGCFHPTFTGTGFDLDHISLMAVRVATATLCHGLDNGYPDFDWDVAVLNLWDKNSKLPISPQWKTNKLQKYYGERNEAFKEVMVEQ